MDWMEGGEKEEESQVTLRLQTSKRETVSLGYTLPELSIWTSTSTYN